MKPEERVITFPIMGRKNSEVIKDFLESLGLKVILPPPITDKTIKLGVKYSSDMMCFPYKVTLGNFIESLNMGANSILMYSTEGTCRFRQYSYLHNFTLKNLGYNFEMNVIKSNFLPILRNLSGKSYLKIIKNLFYYYKRLKGSQVWSKDKPNIGIIGEVYCCNDETVNYGLENKIRRFGGNPINTANLVEWVKDNLGIFNLFGFLKRDEKKIYKKQALKYFNGPLGGHAYENLYNLMYLINKGVDGIIHVLPLSCMPESTIEPYIDHLCNTNNIPLLRISIDENNSEANLVTRLETFIELINWRKRK